MEHSTGCKRGFPKKGSGNLRKFRTGLFWNNEPRLISFLFFLPYIGSRNFRALKLHKGKAIMSKIKKTLEKFREDFLSINFKSSRSKFSERLLKRRLHYFRMRIESISGNTMKFSSSSFGKWPKAFDAVDVWIFRCKFILWMIAAVMFIQTHIDQNIVITPALRVIEFRETRPRMTDCMLRLWHIRDNLSENRAACLCRGQRQYV